MASRMRCGRFQRSLCYNPLLSEADSTLLRFSSVGLVFCDVSAAPELSRGPRYVSATTTFVADCQLPVTTLNNETRSISFNLSHITRSVCPESLADLQRVEPTLQSVIFILCRRCLGFCWVRARACVGGSNAFCWRDRRQSGSHTFGSRAHWVRE